MFLSCPDSPQFQNFIAGSIKHYPVMFSKDGLCSEVNMDFMRGRF